MPVQSDEITVERVEPSGLAQAARVLAEAFAEDPVLLWSMPGARLNDLTAYFTFFLRRNRAQGREIFATSDGSAVAVITRVPQAGDAEREGAGSLPVLSRAESPAAGYFRWIELFRPRIEHHYLEFIGIAPAHHGKGRGSLLLKNRMAAAASQGFPVWCWSSNPRNLTFYHRLGFKAVADLSRDADTPAVTSLLWTP